MAWGFKRIPLILIAVINILFVIKYGTRFIGAYSYMAAGIITVFYILLAGIGVPVLNKLNKYKSGLIIITIFSGMVLCVAVDAIVKPESVLVDRWSAIVNWDVKFLHGEYPYAARTHLGGVVSGLPGLFFITMPFYFAGDVGYFQATTVLLFALCCFLLFKKEKALMAFLLFFLSVGFLWEVYVRSDIGGNSVLVALYLVLIEQMRKNSTGKKMFFAGIIMGILMTTRTVFVIPFVIYLIRWIDFRKKGPVALFLISSVIVFCSFLLPFVAGHFDTFLSNNPFIEQTDKMPVGISILFIGIAIVCGFFTKTIDRALLTSGYLLFTLIGIAFVIKIIKMNFYEAFWANHFDISYFMIALPFLVLSVFNTDYCDFKDFKSRG
jgi:hypothetical protein